MKEVKTNWESLCKEVAAFFLRAGAFDSQDNFVQNLVNLGNCCGLFKPGYFSTDVSQTRAWFPCLPTLPQKFIHLVMWCSGNYS